MTAVPTADIRKQLRVKAGEFIARYYRHDVLRARAVRGIQDEAVAEFEREIVNPALKAVAVRLATFDERGPAVAIEQRPELIELRNEIVGIVKRGAVSVRILTTNSLADLTRAEVEWSRDTAERTLRVAPPAIDAQAIQQDAMDRPFLGQKFDAWFGDMLTQPAAKQSIQWIQTGITQGLSVDQIVKGMRGTPSSDYSDGWLTGSGRDLATLVRTTATHFASVANTEAFRKLGFDRYRWVATLDTRSCAVCGALDGQVFELGKGPLPPSPHPNCRCAVVPWFGEEVEGNRASQDGPVPAKVKFEDWLQGQGIEAQNDVLGATRAKAWRSGDIELADLFGRDLQPLTLAELRRLDRL